MVHAPVQRIPLPPEASRVHWLLQASPCERGGGFGPQPVAGVLSHDRVSSVPHCFAELMKCLPQRPSRCRKNKTPPIGDEVARQLALRSSAEWIGMGDRPLKRRGHPFQRDLQHRTAAHDGLKNKKPRVSAGLSSRRVWWLWVDSNHRPQHYECCALTG